MKLRGVTTTSWLLGQNTRIENVFQLFTAHCSRGGKTLQRKLPMASKPLPTRFFGRRALLRKFSLFGTCVEVAAELRCCVAITVSCNCGRGAIRLQSSNSGARDSRVHCTMTMLRQARIGRAIRVTEIVAGNERPHAENRPVPSEVLPVEAHRARSLRSGRCGCVPLFLFLAVKRASSVPGATWLLCT